LSYFLVCIHFCYFPPCRDYITDADELFAREVIGSLSQLAARLPSASKQVLQILLDALEIAQLPYVVETSIIVLQGILFLSLSFLLLLLLLLLFSLSVRCFMYSMTRNAVPVFVAVFGYSPQAGAFIGNYSRSQGYCMLCFIFLENRLTLIHLLGRSDYDDWKLWRDYRRIAVSNRRVGREMGRERRSGEIRTAAFDTQYFLSGMMNFYLLVSACF
jgi:hypothetical protein